MVIRRRVHAGHIYLGKGVLEAIGIKNGDLVDLEVKKGVIIIKPVKRLDEDTAMLLKMLEKPADRGDEEDYFSEYEYEDIGG